jgi:hypothetical protein
MSSKTHALAEFRQELARQNQEFERALVSLGALDAGLEFFVSKSFIEELDCVCAPKPRRSASNPGLRA